MRKSVVADSGDPTVDHESLFLVLCLSQRFKEGTLFIILFPRIAQYISMLLENKKVPVG